MSRDAARARTLGGSGGGRHPHAAQREMAVAAYGGRRSAAAKPRHSHASNTGPKLSQQLQPHKGPKRKPPHRAGGLTAHPRARFPTNFPQRVADGSEHNAQILTVDRDAPPPGLDENLPGPNCATAALPHAEMATERAKRQQRPSSRQQRSPPIPIAGRPASSAGASAASAAAAPDGIASALSELASLQRLAKDPLDEARYARPQTAAGAIGGSPGAAGLAPGTAVSRAADEEEESADKLRVRLSAAEAVMRKLHRRNSQLEESAKESAARPQTAAAVPGEEDTGAQLLAGADEQALFLLQQKEADLQQMRDYTAQLSEQLRSAEAQQQQGRPAAATASATDSGEYRDRYMRMRSDYRSLLRSRVGSLKRTTVQQQQREQSELLGKLDAALQEEAELHRRESQRLNEELYLREKQSCDWHVERRILESRLAEMDKSLRMRDEIDGAIESKMSALFARLQSLESQNIQLEQANEQLKTQVSGGGSGDGGGPPV